jgi:hypothetical protein
MKKLLIAGVFALALAGASAHAANFNAKITNIDGSPILDDKGKAVELTVRGICMNALMAPLSAEEQAKADSGTEKTRRFELAGHVLKAAYPDNAKGVPAPDHYIFTAEDIALMKKLVNAQYPSPLTVTQTWRALEEK